MRVVSSTFSIDRADVSNQLGIFVEGFWPSHADFHGSIESSISSSLVTSRHLPSEHFSVVSRICCCRKLSSRLWNVESRGFFFLSFFPFRVHDISSRHLIQHDAGQVEIYQARCLHEDSGRCKGQDHFWWYCHHRLADCGPIPGMGRMGRLQKDNHPPGAYSR